MLSRHRIRSGFTIVELLCVISLVGVVLALSMPSVLQARAQARNTRCINNLKQVGLAMHNYHDTYNTFPPAWINLPHSQTNGRGHGWLVALTPYLDQAPLYNQLDFNKRFLPDSSAQSLAALKTPIPTLRCSNDKTPALNPYRENWATSNYSGNIGHRALPVWSGSPSQAYWPGALGILHDQKDLAKLTGIMTPNSNTKIYEITDGTSNTMMVGERSLKSGAGIWSGITAANHYNDLVTDGSHASRLNESLSGYSSQHTGINFTLCDGSVRTIKPTVDSQPDDENGAPVGVFQKLCNRSDGQVIGEF